MPTTERVPLVANIETRDGTLSKDARMVNVVVEQEGHSNNIVKRPGLVLLRQITAVTPPATIPSQGLVGFSSNVIAAINNTIWLYTVGLGTLTNLGTMTGSTSKKAYFARAFQDSILFFHNTTLGYTYTPGGGSLGTPTLPEASFVPGAVYLNNFFYIGSSTTNLIYSSNINNPSTWSSLASVAFYLTTDSLVGIAKHLNYLVAFGDTSTQFYYDTGNGSNTLNPLAPAASYSFEIGCANGDSIASADNSVMWVGHSRTHGKSVFILDGVSPIKVSTPSIDKILEKSDYSKVSSYAFKFWGHTLYILTLHDLNITLAYDMTTKMWSQWTQYSQASNDQPNPGTFYESYFRPCYYAEIGNQTYLLDDDTAKMYNFSNTTYQDDGQPIYCRVITDLKDMGTTHRKFFGRLEVIGDKLPTSDLCYISHTDNDYASYSTPRSIDLSLSRAQIHQGGASRRRAWNFLYTGNQPLRLSQMEIDFRIGEMDQTQG
jgi:hypothetical protein